MIRRALTTDAAAVGHIHVESWSVAYRGIMPDGVIAKTDLAYRTRFWAVRIADREWPVFVIEVEGKAIAFCQMIPSQDLDDDPKRVGHITSLHVLPHLRGRGYGRVLMDHVLDEFRRRGFAEVTLWVLEENRSARRFYEKHGFTLDGGKRMYPNTAIPEVRYRIKALPLTLPAAQLPSDTVSFADHFSGVSAAYAAFRPRYPDALFDFLARAAPALEAAWDCGTGSGQAAIGLARHFHKVFATDASESQLEHALRHSRITYRVAPAEASGLEDASVDLVAAAQALHWFDRPKFWAEARRVMRPRGVVAVWTYLLLEIAPEIDAIVREFYSDVVGPFWPPERHITEERYRTIEFPFAEFAAPNFLIEQQVTLDDVTGYIRTWSATRAFMRHHRQDPVDTLVAKLAGPWGAPQSARLARWPVAMRIGRI